MEKSLFDEFYESYKLLINAIFDAFAVDDKGSFTEGGLRSKDFEKLRATLLSDDARAEFMRAFSAKSINEYPAIKILGGEYRHVGSLWKKDVAAISEIAVSGANEVLSSTREIFDDLPAWVKTSLKVVQEGINLAWPTFKTFGKQFMSLFEKLKPKDRPKETQKKNQK